MDRPTDELLTRVLRSSAALSEGRAAQLVSEARAQAESEVKAILKSAMKAALLNRAAIELESIEAPAERHQAIPNEPHDQAQPGTYVYAIARASDELPAKLGPGIAPVQVIRHGQLQAIVSHVPVEGFGTNEQLRDLDWISRHVHAHDGVIKAAMTAGPVIPLRFCTVFRDDPRVRELLDHHRQRLLRTLDQLDGKREWGVKIRIDGAAPATSNGNSTSGREYLDHKRRGGSKAVLQQKRKDIAPEAHRRLSELAVESTSLPLRDTERDASLLFNGAYLVAHERLDEFRALVAALSDEHRGQGMSFDQTGPWPPYNFVRLDLSRETEALSR